MRLTSECGMFEAWVEVDGRETETYQVKHFGAGIVQRKRTEGWICSESGKNWKVKVSCSRFFRSPGGMQPQYKDIEANIFVDGVRIGAAVTKTASGNDILWRDSINIGSGARGKLKFSQANVVDTTDVLDEITAKSLATIELRLNRVERSQTKRRPSLKRDAGDLASAVGVPERSKKGALSHLTDLGPLYANTSGTHKAVKHPNDEQYGPFRKIIFRYASYDVLLASGIIPRPEAADAELEEDSPEIIDVDDEQDNQDGIKSEAGDEADEGEEDVGGEGRRALEAHEERLRAIRAELEQAEAAQRETQAALAAKKRKRNDADGEDNKAAVKRKVDLEMKRVLEEKKRLEGDVVDLTLDD